VPPNIIIAADVVYYKELVDPLLSTLASLTDIPASEDTDRAAALSSEAGGGGVQVGVASSKSPLLPEPSVACDDASAAGAPPPAIETASIGELTSASTTTFAAAHPDVGVVP